MSIDLLVGVDSLTFSDPADGAENRNSAQQLQAHWRVMAQCTAPAYVPISLLLGRRKAQASPTQGAPTGARIQAATSRQ
jgi:hypothetical protein